MGHDEGVAASLRHYSSQSLERFGASRIFSRGDDESTLSQVRSCGRRFSAHQLRRLRRPVEFAGIDFPERNPKRAE